MKMEFTTDLVVFSSPKLDLSEISAEGRRIFLIEEARTIFDSEGTYHLQEKVSGIFSVTPYLPKECSVFEKKEFLLGMIREFLTDEEVHDYSILTATPKAMPFLRTLSPVRIVYLQDEGLSLKYPELHAELLEYADEIESFELEYSSNPWISHEERMSSRL